MASTNAPAVAIGMQKSSDSNRRNQPSNPATSTRSHEDKTPCYDLDCGDCCAFNDIDCKDGCTDCSCDSCVSSCKGCLPTISVESEKHTRMLLLSGLCIQLLASLLYIIATSTPHWTIIDSSTVLARAGLWGGQYNGRRYIVSSDTACDLFIDGLGVEGGAAIIGLDPKDCESLNGQRATCLLATMFTVLGAFLMTTSMYKGRETGLKHYQFGNVFAAAGSFFGMVCMAIVVDRKEEEAEFGVSFELLTTAWVFQFIFSIIITFFLTKTEDVAIESG